jgi:hypothetical protein
MGKFDDMDAEDMFGDPDPDWEPSPEEIREIEAAMQDMDEGFGYEMLRDENDELTWTFKCLKCGRTAELHERPFPHRYDCEMRRRYGD